MTDETLRRTLLLEAHQRIAQAARDAVAQLRKGSASVLYPPDDALTLTAEEVSQLAALSLSDVQAAGLEKLVADACASFFFHWLCLVDAVGDPEIAPLDEHWLGARIVAPPAKEEGYVAMWHDEFYELFHEYLERKTKS